MRILICTPSFIGGGAERISVNLANYYALNKHEVLLLCFQAKGPYLSQISDGVELVNVNSRLRYAYFKLLIILKKKKPDLILSMIRGTNIILGAASIICKSKMIFREANTMHAIKQLPFLKRSVYKNLMRFSYRKAGIIITNSEDTKLDLIKYNIVNSRKCRVIGNPVLPSNHVQLAMKLIDHDWFNDERFKVILNVGRLHKQKNQAMLIHAFAIVYKIIPDARLVILGEGEEFNNLITLIGQYKLSDVVQILPFKENPYPYYKKASVFVLTSDWEGFGNVIVEAMACGTPVISRNCPGGPKAILKNGEYGTLTDMNDLNELSNKIIVELTNSTSSMKIQKAKNRALDFTIKHVAQEYLSVLSNR